MPLLTLSYGIQQDNKGTEQLFTTTLHYQKLEW